MVSFMDSGYGTKKGIPQMILAGASCDDVYVIVLFTSFLGMVQGGSLSLGSFLGFLFLLAWGIGWCSFRIGTFYLF